MDSSNFQENWVQIDCISTSLRHCLNKNENILYFDFCSKIDSDYKYKCYYVSFMEFIIQMNIKNLFTLETPIGKIQYKLFIMNEVIKIGIIINNIETITRNDIERYIHYIERHLVGFDISNEMYEFRTNNKPKILIKMDEKTNLISMD